MRVAYVGNFRPSHSTENHVAGSLRALGHDVVQFQEDEQVQSLDTLAARAVDEQVSLLLYTKTWGLDPDETMRQWAILDAAGVPTASYHLDLYVGLEREVQLDSDPFWRTRFVFSADGGHDAEFAAHGIDHEWLRPGVYRPECVDGRPQRSMQRFHVGFVGSHRWYHPEWPYRQQLVKWLKVTYRGRAGIFPQGTQAVRGQALNDLYASVPVIVGDTLCPGFDQPRYWSDRVYETLGRGGFLIHPWIEGLDDEFVDGEHLRFYRYGDFDGLRSLIDHYVAHPAEAREIAHRGQAYVRDECSYQNRVQTMLDRLRAKGAFDKVTATTRPTVMTLGRWRGAFEPRDETNDVTVLREVWQSNDYRVDKARGVSGTVVDLGANIGGFTVLAALAGARRVIAVEPHPENRARLEHHVRLNGVADRVEIVAAAVSDRDGARVTMSGVGGGAHCDETGDVEVDTIRLDTLLARYGPISLLKCDVEGGEYPAFAAIDSSALLCVAQIALEFHGPAMPHLAHLADPQVDLLDDALNARWHDVMHFGALVAKLADAGRVEAFGHPSRGGLLFWTLY